MRVVPEDTPLGLPNCGVVAVAMLAGVSYEEARAAVASCRDHGNHPSWKGRTYPEERLGALVKLGVVMKRMRSFERTTLNRFSQKVEPYYGAWMVDAGGHSVAIIDGIMYDQHNVRGTSVGREFAGRRHRVVRCYKVV